VWFDVGELKKSPMHFSHSHITSWQQLLRGRSRQLSDWLVRCEQRKLWLCVVCILIGGGLYGATIGVWRSPLMGLYVGVKLPLLIFLTLGCNAVLNGVLGLLLGSGLGILRSLFALLMSYAVFSMVLGALSPVALFLAMNSPAPDAPNASLAHSICLLIHTGLIAFAGLMSNMHLLRTLVAYCPTPQVARVTLFSWLAGNAFVGGQFSWILRPFFGSPNLEVAFLREDAMEGTFYGAVGRSLVNVLPSVSPSLVLILLVSALIAGVVTLSLHSTNQL